MRSRRYGCQVIEVISCLSWGKCGKEKSKRRKKAATQERIQAVRNWEFGVVLLLVGKHNRNQDPGTFFQMYKHFPKANL